MKRFSFLLAVLLSVQTFARTKDFSFSSNLFVRSKYVGPSGLVFYPDPVTQGSFTIIHKSGFFFDLWGSTGFNRDWSKDWDDEIDYTLGYNGELEYLNLSISVSYFDDFPVGRFAYNDVIMTNLRIDDRKKINCFFYLTPFFKYNNYIIPDKKTPFKGGNLFSVGVDSDYILLHRVKLNSSLQTLFDDGAFGSKAGLLLKGASALELLLSKKASWNMISIEAYVPIGNRGFDHQFVFSSGLSFNF